MRFFLFLFSLLALTGAVHAQEPARLRIVNYNVLHGFNNDSLLEKRFVEWANKQNADIFTFQELNGFTAERLEELAAKYGHPYAVINTGVTHPIGISSKYPIVMVQHVTTNMWHSYLYGNIKGIHVFVTHLSPFDVKSRRADIDRVLAHAKLLPKGEKILVAGDFNALAYVDAQAAQYDQKLLPSMLKSEGRLEPKSGLPIVKGKIIYRNNLDNGKIDYTVTNKMLAAGFEDSHYLTSKVFKSSAPTRSHAGNSGREKRIDYIWLNKTMAATVKKSGIIQDIETEQLSDHYPVFVECSIND